MTATAAALATTRPDGLPLRTPIGDIMGYEILINEQSTVWVFHDRPIPYRIAWIEFDPVTGLIEFMPHDMRMGILYAEAPAPLQARFRTSRLGYLYETGGDQVLNALRVPVRLKK